jgi:hypothetical protein
MDKYEEIVENGKVHMDFFFFRIRIIICILDKLENKGLRFLVGFCTESSK